MTTAFDDTGFPFDQYQRYATVRNLVGGIKTALGMAEVRVLDVGGFFLLASGEVRFPIRATLPEDDPLVVDVVPCSLGPYVRGSGLSLPFRDGSFDVVVSCDALEHIAASDRPKFIVELARVARQYVILAMPVDGQSTRMAEAIVDQFIRLHLGVQQQQLLEHISFGLPRAAEVTMALESAGLQAVSFPCEDLYGWLLMMLAKHYLLSIPDSASLHAMVDHFYISNFPQGPLPETEAGRCYRRFFVASKLKNDPYLEVLKKERESCSGYGEASPGCPYTDHALLNLDLAQMMITLTIAEKTLSQWETWGRALEEKRQYEPQLSSLGSQPGVGWQQAREQRRQEWRALGQASGRPGLENAGVVGKSYFVLRHRGAGALLREIWDYGRWICHRRQD